MWDGRLDWVGIAKHGITLTSPDIRLINSASYHDSPEAQKLEEKELDQMIRMNVMEPV